MSHREVGTTLAQETLEVGHSLSRQLRAGDVVLLRGPLGAGKSVLARGVAEGLGVRRWRGSPTFALLNEYETIPPLYHADLYRLTADEVEDLHLEELLDDGILLVEWPERAGTFWDTVGRRHIEITIAILSLEERLITLQVAEIETPC